MLNTIRFSSTMPMRALGVPYPGTAPFYPATAPPPSPQLGRVQARQLKTMGNDYRRLKLYPQAIEAYQNAIKTDPTYTDAYYNLAQLLDTMGQPRQAIGVLTRLLFANPNDHDARVVLGEYYEQVGNTREAKKRYMEVLDVRPDFDPARRRLDYLLYLDQKKFYPELAQRLLKTQYREVVHKARELLKQYYTIHHPNPVLLQYSQTFPLEFATTQSVAESANLAEYDATRGVIRIQPQMLFSTPNIVGAYLAHELRHAIDNDTRTSIMEEQNGYRELARFWSIYQGAENDPNLDRAVELYQQSPDALDQEVRRVYTIRDGNIPEKSPGHGLPPHSRDGVAFEFYEREAQQKANEQLRKVLALKGPLYA